MGVQALAGNGVALKRPIRPVEVDDLNHSKDSQGEMQTVIDDLQERLSLLGRAGRPVA